MMQLPFRHEILVRFFGGGGVPRMLLTHLMREKVSIF